MQTNILQKSHPDSRFKLIHENDVSRAFSGNAFARVDTGEGDYGYQDATILQIMFTPKGDYLVEFVLKEEEDE